MTPYLLHHFLHASARSRPDAVAVIDRTQSITYRALDEISNRLANLLRARGIAKGDRVGIDLDKSLEAVIAIYGILKAGAAYVPIDARAPVRRAALVVKDCGMAGLITTGARVGKLRAELAQLPACVVLADASAWPAVLAASAEAPPDPGLIEQDLAYVLYTSGSTGQPKGVMLSHRAALSFVNWAVDYLEPTADDRFSNHAPLHFDLSVLDLFAAAAVGGSVALVPASVTLFPRNLADWIEQSAISIWYSVPSALTQLALQGGLERHTYSRLRLVLFAGEVFPIRHLRELMRQLPRPAYFNLYGPTETNVCTAYRVAGMPAPDSAPLPIGRACANTEVFVHDGELLVRGPTLMQGYWGKPEQTQKVLVPHPLHADRLERVYRTGDLVREDELGDYHFIGRRDSQVKSRGYRIELGDVEAALYRHPDIAEAAVLAQPHEEFGATLRAVIVPRAGVELDARRLATFCAEHLPHYMIPADFELRDALPKTSSGKIDRTALRTAH
jgi:amino acid adenylation domain-containing protein